MFDNIYSKQVIDSIKQSQGATLPFIIKDLIKSNSGDSDRMKKLWEEYKGNVPIKTDPRVSNPAIPNNRVANDYRGIIVQQISSYLFGNAVKYILDDKTQNYENAKNIVDTFLKRTNYEQLDSETEVYAATCGKAFRILYYSDWIDGFGNKSVQLLQKNIKPWEALIINDATIDEPIYGMIYYQVEVNISNTQKKYRYRVEWYDSENVYYYMEDDSGNYTPDYTYGEYVQPHGFLFMPLIKFSNNTLEMGDFEKVRTNIDAYDRAISYSIDDMQSFAQAYLLFYGVEPTQEILDAARKSGAFYVPADNDADANNKVEFLTKDIKIENTTEITKILNADIYKFAAAIDMNDESFSGAAQTGESRKWKLLPLEFRAKEKERLYIKGLQNLFKVASSFWNKISGIKINYEEMRFVFTRSLPIDLSVNDLAILKGAGIITTETALEQLRVIDNPSAEAEAVKEEKAQEGLIFNLDNFNTTGSMN